MIKPLGAPLILSFTLRHRRLKVLVCVSRFLTRMAESASCLPGDAFLVTTRADRAKQCMCVVETRIFLHKTPPSDWASAGEQASHSECSDGIFPRMLPLDKGGLCSERASSQWRIRKFL